MPPADTREYKAAAIGQNSYVSIGLVVSLVLGAMFYGKQLQRLDTVEAKLSEVVVEMRRQNDLLQTISRGR